jgi:hypothetical protein
MKKSNLLRNILTPPKNVTKSIALDSSLPKDCKTWNDLLHLLSTKDKINGA